MKTIIKTTSGQYTIKRTQSEGTQEPGKKIRALMPIFEEDSASEQLETIPVYKNIIRKSRRRVACNSIGPKSLAPFYLAPEKLSLDWENMP